MAGQMTRSRAIIIVLPLRVFFADGMIPFFGRYGSTDVHDTTSGSADSGIGLYLLLLDDNQNMLKMWSACFVVFDWFSVVFFCMRWLFTSMIKNSYT